MVTSVTNLGRSGLSDWLVQRVTAVVLLAYFIFIAATLLFNPDLQYAQWVAFFDRLPVKVFSLAAILSLAMHAWIGLWSVSTDYLTTRMMGARGTALRLVFQAVSAVLLFVYVVWGIQILWG